MWIITNQGLRELYKGLDIAADIKQKRLQWIGHVITMDQGRTVKKILGSKLYVSRQRGRLRLRWLGRFWRRFCRRLRLRDGDRRQLIGKNGHPQLWR
jgi:hypothetical protein